LPPVEISQFSQFAFFCCTTTLLFISENLPKCAGVFVAACDRIAPMSYPRDSRIRNNASPAVCNAIPDVGHPRHGRCGVEIERGVFRRVPQTEAATGVHTAKEPSWRHLEVDNSYETAIDERLSHSHRTIIRRTRRVARVAGRLPLPLASPRRSGFEVRFDPAEVAARELGDGPAGVGPIEQRPPAHKEVAPEERIVVLFLRT